MSEGTTNWREAMFLIEQELEILEKYRARERKKLLKRCGNCKHKMECYPHKPSHKCNPICGLQNWKPRKEK